MPLPIDLTDSSFDQGLPQLAALGIMHGLSAFLLVNAILFLRPSEIFPELASVGIYEVRHPLLPGLFGSGRGRAVFRRNRCTARPITVGVLLLWPLCGLSQVMRLDMVAGGRSAFSDFFKVVVYYLLLVGVVNTPARLRIFLFALGIFITC